MRKWGFAVVLGAGLVLTGATFGFVRGRAAAVNPGGATVPGVVSVVETAAPQDAPARYPGRGGCGARGGCGGRAGQAARRGCCSGPQGAAGPAGEAAGTFLLDRTAPVERYEALLADHYARTVGAPVQVRVRDFGCHQEAEVTRGGKLIKRLSISGGTVTEIG